jgi:NTP pyrophosphatase (non-canonical NTP hydrolase)
MLKKDLKFRLRGIRSLAMLKMEKNFIAFCEKSYPRQPYRDPKQTIAFSIDRIGEELKELIDAYDNLDTQTMMEECADISNLVDYLFEKLLARGR